MSDGEFGDQIAADRLEERGLIYLARFIRGEVEPPAWMIELLTHGADADLPLELGRTYSVPSMKFFGRPARGIIIDRDVPNLLKGNTNVRIEVALIAPIAPAPFDFERGFNNEPGHD